MSNPRGIILLMYVDTTEPVKWKIRCTLTLKDAKTLIAVSLKFSILAFVSNIPKWFKEPAHPGDFQSSYHLRQQLLGIREEDEARLSPLLHGHVNMLGHYLKISE
jgi:hypothetical protein